MKRLAIVLATCCGAGNAPVAPGTAGAAVGLLVVFLTYRAPLLYFAVAILLLLAGQWASAVAEIEFGRKDSPRIVIDEAVGTMVTFAGIGLSGPAIIAGFLLNRLMDIVKPWPAMRLQEREGGWAVMLDDVAAGVYSNLILRLFLLIAG